MQADHTPKKKKKEKLKIPKKKKKKIMDGRHLVWGYVNRLRHVEKLAYGIVVILLSLSVPPNN